MDLRMKRFCGTYNMKDDEKKNGPENVQIRQDKVLAMAQKSKLAVDNGWVTYMTWGEETSKTGTFHLQIYMQTKKRKKLGALVKYFSDNRKKKTTWGIHWEKQRAKSNAVARDYCWKECGEAKWEYGEFEAGGQGTRTDIHTAIAKIKEGKGDLRDLMDDHAEMIVKYPGGFAKLAAMVAESKVPNLRKVTVIWLWGDTDSGKTYAATEGGKRESYYIKKCICFKNQKFMFDDYRGEDTLILDEFASNCMDIKQLMQYLDGEKLRLEIKNAHTFARWTRVIITNNFPYPESVYPGAFQGNRDALFRRVNIVREMNKPWKEQTPPTWDSDLEKSPTPPGVDDNKVPIRPEVVNPAEGLSSVK